MGTGLGLCPKSFPLTAFLQSSAKKARWAAMCPWAAGHRPSALRRVALGLCWHGPGAGVTPSLGRTCATCPSSVVPSVRLVHDVNSVSGNAADGTWHKCGCSSACSVWVELLVSVCPVMPGLPPRRPRWHEDETGQTQSVFRRPFVLKRELKSV